MNGKKKKPLIPIKNLFYMLCYAWNVLSILDDVKLGNDDYDDAYNLFARVFSFGIGKLIRSGFHRSYIEDSEELSTLRGKISVQESINALSFERKKLVCSFDEYSSNDIFNQILKFTMLQLIRNSQVDISIKKDLKSQLVFFDGIDATAPTKEKRQQLKFNRNNVTYKLLINVAIMLYDNTVVSDEEGINTFKDFFRQEQMHKVFEMFILNFYSMHLPKEKYKVHAPKINWQIDIEAADAWAGLFDVDTNPGDRRTDIVIENKELNLQLIIDAKYYEKTFVSAYMDSNSEEYKIRRAHLDQVRGYLIDSLFEGAKMGALLYPMVNNDLQKGKAFPIKDTQIFVKTINLNSEWRDIENDMLDFLKRLEVAYTLKKD